MPTQTFLNLPPDKRMRLMRAATEEFAAHDFAKAKLDRIATGAKIPKGSLYQYFGGKEDFYVHTAREALEEAWRLFEDHVARTQPVDCFALLVEAIVHMIDLKRDHPHLATLYSRVVYTKDSQSREALHEVFLAYNDAFYQRLIPWGIDDGLIDPELPTDVIRFHLSSVGAHFQYLILMGVEPGPWHHLGDGDALRPFVHQVVRGLRRAVAPPGPTPSRTLGVSK